jgi:negative regulator of flagellin synthesis FlgM
MPIIYKEAGTLMMIDKLGYINPIDTVQSTQRTASTKPVSPRPDTIALSTEAQEMAEAYYLAQVASETPDVRHDLVEQIKARIQDPGYLNSAVINSVADKLLDSFGL